MAGNPVVGFDLNQGGYLLPANAFDLGTTGVEAAPGRGRNGGRHVTGQKLALMSPLFGIGRGHGNGR
jgi:hypothetical protein